ncbi:phosphoglycerate mutase [Klebsiella michiganensis]|uniref:Phosphoglycerate mutase n=1 Tax=Klebsiella michiganensis TaxID=1134687 RepID=A0A7H4M0Y3_9ENTR|nr:phosphoglycerate mutase [Klebsiella michiganensis]
MKKWLIALMMAAGAATCSAAEVKNDDGVNIYFARHGKTLLNTFDRVQGWADSPLTEDGIRVARYLGEGLKVFRLIASIPAMPDVSVKPCR